MKLKLEKRYEDKVFGKIVGMYDYTINNYKSTFDYTKLKDNLGTLYVVEFSVGGRYELRNILEIKNKIIEIYNNTNKEMYFEIQ